MSEGWIAWPASGSRRLRDAASTQRRRPRIGEGHDRGKIGYRDEWLTVDQVCAELNIGRRTFERWRTLGIAPRATRPTRYGPLRIKRCWLEEWADVGAR